MVVSMSSSAYFLLFSCWFIITIIVAQQDTLPDTVFADCEHYNLAQDASEPQPGMHLLCVKHVGDGTVNVSMLKDGHEEIRFVHPHDTGDDFHLFHQIEQLIEITNNRPVSKWKVFSLQGRRLWSVDRLAYDQVAIIYTNGLWIWPGVQPGHQWDLGDTTLTTLSLRPLVFKAEEFLTDEECNYIIDQSAPHLVASKTSKMDKDRDKPDTTWRTSTQYFLPSRGHDVVQDIDWRVALLTKSTMQQQEYVQVLRYEEGQKYDQHTDYFDVRFYQSDPTTLKNIKNGEKNRLATVLWYLSTVEDGGHTVFPRAFGATPSNSSDCSVGLRVTPTKGEVVIFYSLTADGAIDPFSLHGACPVGSGVKWAANKWIWTESTGFYEEQYEDNDEEAKDEEGEEEEDVNGDEGWDEGAGGIDVDEEQKDKWGTERSHNDGTEL